jgi:hypothetical protein
MVGSQTKPWARPMAAMGRREALASARERDLRLRVPASGRPEHALRVENGRRLPAESGPTEIRIRGKRNFVQRCACFFTEAGHRSRSEAIRRA